MLLHVYDILYRDVSSRPTAADLLSHDFLSPSSVPTAACAAPKADATGMYVHTLVHLLMK